MNRRVGQPKIIHWINNPSAKKLAPHAVSHRFGEKWIFWRQQPLGQRPPRISPRHHHRQRSVRRLRRHDLACHRMLQHPVRHHKKRLVATRNRSRNSPALLPQRGKKGRHPMEIFLTPLLVRMMMTLSAIQPNPEKKLAEHRRQISRLPAVAINNSRPVPVRVPLRQNDLSDKLIRRHVFTKRVADPVVQEQHTLDPDPVGIGPQQICPLHPPMVSISRIRQQPIDRFPPLLRIDINQKFPRRRRRWQSANRV